MHPWKESWRGFNQSEALARAFAAGAGLQFAPNVLRRRFRRKAQAEVQDKAERQRNAQGSVAVRRRFAPGTRFILADDVFTTGATMNACAVALKSAGAGEVTAVTFLRKE